MSADVLFFPNVRLCVETYLEGVHDDAPDAFPMPIKVTWRLPANAFTPPYDDAIVHIQQVPAGNSEGYIDRVDRLRLDCYAPGEVALGTLNAVKALLVGAGIETPHGYLDTVTVVPGRAPVEVEFQSDTLNLASMQLDIVTRPIN